VYEKLEEILSVWTNNEGLFKLRVGKEPYSVRPKDRLTLLGKE